MQQTQPHVIWINGTFGSGKTTAAKLLAQKVPGAVIVDPEEIGALLMPVLQPVVPVQDFQEWPAWRKLVASTLNAILRELPEDSPMSIVVPQTVTVEDYWSEITSDFDPSIRLTPVVLNIDPVEHRRRAEEDTEEPNALQWRLNNFPVFQQSAWLQRAFTDIDVSSLTQEQTVAAIRAVAFPPDREAV